MRIRVLPFRYSGDCPGVRPTDTLDSETRRLPEVENLVAKERLLVMANGAASVVLVPMFAAYHQRHFLNQH